MIRKMEYNTRATIFPFLLFIFFGYAVTTNNGIKIDEFVRQIVDNYGK